jgi:hypothetical protein
MAVYNLTNVTSSVDMLQMTASLNSLSGGILGPGILIVLVVIIFMSLRAATTAETEVVIATTMWFGIILAIMFRAINFISSTGLIIFGVLSLLTIGFMWSKKD